MAEQLVLVALFDNLKMAGYSPTPELAAAVTIIP
jgi:hypothetical protein